MAVLVDWDFELYASPTLTDLHLTTLRRFEVFARECCQHEQEASLDVARDFQNAPQTYGAVQVSTTAFTLSLDAVLPTLPSPGIAAQVDILPLVSSETREWLLNPSLVLYPESTDLGELVTTARVLVDSQCSYDQLISALWERGIVEPAEESE
eukprot:6470527-Amphidinium_carterae.1